MDTRELIEALAAGARRPAPSLSTAWWGAAGLSAALAAAAVVAMLGPRPDIAAAADSARFLFKLVAMLTLAASAFAVVRALSRPGQSWRRAVAFIAAAPALIALAVLIELVMLPPDAWAASLVGDNSLACFLSISLIGLGPLAAFLVALRHGAPTRPGLAGAAAGLLAGALAATAYALHCTDDSPLFVATWYTFAIVGLALIGAAGANQFARW